MLIEHFFANVKKVVNSTTKTMARAFDSDSDEFNTLLLEFWNLFSLSMTDKSNKIRLFLTRYFSKDILTLVMNIKTLCKDLSYINNCGQEALVILYIRLSKI